MSLELGRRSVLIGMCATCAYVVTGCAEGTGTTTTGTGSAAGLPSGKVLAKLSDVPVGGAVVVAGPDGRPMAVTRPDASTVLALSAICTHQGCTVQPAGGELDCPCHGSTFDLHGDNTGGPAPVPLPSFPVKVVDGNVVTA